MKHRTPPKPAHYENPAPGQCKWCGELVLKSDGSVNKRSHWHQNCVNEYKLIYWPRVTRITVYRRDKGKCACCGKLCRKGQWDMDHIQPLIEAQGNLDYWRLGNLQTLCTECHVKKTSAEATARAEARKAAKAQKALTESPKKVKKKK